MRAFYSAFLLAFDLDDGKGNASFSKLVTLALLATAIRLMWGAPIKDIGPSVVALVIAILAAAMGRSVFLRYLDRTKP